MSLIERVLVSLLAILLLPLYLAWEWLTLRRQLRRINRNRRAFGLPPVRTLQQYWREQDKA